LKSKNNIESQLLGGKKYSEFIWKTCHFKNLSLFELQLIHQVRQQVFVLEQTCAFVDADEWDTVAHHLTAHAANQALPLAYARLLPPDTKYIEPSIGRVLTQAAARGQGLGRELMRVALGECAALYPGAGLRISAQAHLESFYADFGFVAVKESYLEDGIPHLEMLQMA
jgi:ElaA protein